MRRRRRSFGTALLGREQLTLQACHPRFFATHRYLAFGTLVSLAVRGTTRISPTALAVAASA
jgi:hypothetical protein